MHGSSLSQILLVDNCKICIPQRISLLLKEILGQLGSLVYMAKPSLNILASKYNVYLYRY